MPKSARADGFTLIEVLVAISLMGVVMAFSISGWAGWSRASQQSGTARELQSVLRKTQQQAVTEGTTMCVTVADRTYTVWRSACSSSPSNRADGPMTVGGGVHLTTSGMTTGVAFSARGTSTGGSITVKRDGSSKVLTLTVEGFTGRVSLG